jgi:DNA-binding NtrC family response regulator
MEPKNIVFLDDDELGTKSIIELLSLVIKEKEVVFTHFTTSEQLIEALNGGKRFDLYVLDYYLDEEDYKILGTHSVPKIKAIHPEAILIGRSGDRETAKRFANVGVENFIAKMDNYETFADLITQLIT